MCYNKVVIDIKEDKIMRVFTKNGIKMYPVAMVDFAEHKLYTMEARYENLLDDIYYGDKTVSQSMFDYYENRLDRIHNLLDALVVVNVSGKNYYYASYEDYSLAKELLVEYNIKKYKGGC